MNSSIKKAAKKAVIIIASIITLPFLCHSFDKLSPYLAGFCKTVGRFCAELSFLSPDTPDRLFSHEIQSSSSVFTQLITFPMNEYLPDKNTLHIGSGSAWSIDMAPDEIETPAEIPPLPTPSEEILNAIPYPDNIEDNDGDIVTVHYGTYDSASYITLENGKITGGIGVIENDYHDRKDLTPNICALYVEEGYRCRGIAGRMLDFAAADMKSFGIDKLYLITDHTSFYERYGWNFLCMVQPDGEPEMIRMYVKRLIT